jgi:hypothetical protein
MLRGSAKGRDTGCEFLDGIVVRLATMWAVVV